MVNVEVVAPAPDVASHSTLRAAGGVAAVPGNGAAEDRVLAVQPRRWPWPWGSRDGPGRVHAAANGHKAVRTPLRCAAHSPALSESYTHVHRT